MSPRSPRAERRAAKRRNQRILVIVIILILLGVAGFIAFSGFLNKNNNPTSLKIEDLVLGSGPAAKAGDAISVNYTGWLADGTKFDSSLDHGQPFEFTLGQGGVIQGWDQGVVGMKVGGKRRLTIPPNLAYGAAGYPPIIPPNATLTFEIDLLAIQP